QDVNHNCPVILMEKNSEYNYIGGNRSSEGLSIVLIESYNNEIYSHEESGFLVPNVIKLSMADGNWIHDNEDLDIVLEDDSRFNIIESNITKGISITDGFFNEVMNNTVKNGNTAGIKIISSFGNNKYSWGNIIEGNSIYENDHEGIKIINSYHDQIINNKIYNNGKINEDYPFSGIYMDNAFGTDIMKNKIYKNGEHGIEANYSKNLIIKNNRITHHETVLSAEETMAGIYLFEVNKASLISNILDGNCTGIQQSSSKKITLRSNIINNSSCSSTGIHINNSEVEIIGNSIANNNGNGIISENNSTSVITGNNILGNSEFGLNNADPDAVLNANGNYWGGASGPGVQDINGSVDASSWLSSEVTILAVPEEDTVYASLGITDSTSLFIQNISNPDDRIKLTVNDDKGWVEEINEIEADLEDSTGIAWQLKYTIPGGASENEISTVSFTATSLTDTTIAEGSFYIATYLPVANQMFVSLDSLTVSYGDTVQFTVRCLDQYDNQITVDPVWSASSGTISNEGLFVSDSSSGQIIITALEQASSVQEQSVIYNTNEEPLLTNIIIQPAELNLEPLEIFQFFASGYNQFNFPKSFVAVWEATGGFIENDGLFMADSIPGVYSITVTDTSGQVFGAAVVIISDPTSIDHKENKIPENFFLSQNYPNPFNPATTLDYSIPTTSNVRIEIFNILGQRVALLINQIQGAGYKSVKWEAGRFASGVYILRMSAQAINNREQFYNSRKMILLR
ncbi:MAG: right-handed parallel beta-helix repeat-containing protein, partial [Melioribacteraceae bacterium]|nr:right-handed parallel beta-helix repeat-containing protein [Melioribacteraceae bacterium]